MLRDVVTNDNTASDVWVDTAYRSQANEKWLKRVGRVSRILRRKSRGRPMSERTARANAAKSKVRARVEHVFAHQKDKMDLFIRHHRPTPRRGQDHARQPCLQHASPDPPRTTCSYGVSAPRIRQQRQKPRQQAASGYLNARIARAQPKAAQISGQMEAPNFLHPHRRVAEPGEHTRDTLESLGYFDQKTGNLYVANAVE